MSGAPRQARLELDAALRHPLPRDAAEALVALLGGRAPHPAPCHPLFQRPEAALLLTGESLDHLTQGSRIVQEEDGPRLLASASLPPARGLLEAALDWLSPLLRAEPGALLGFVVPPGSHRHDLRLLAWDGARLCPLGPLAEPAEGDCSADAFRRAAGLPEPRAPAAQLAPAMRRVVLAQLSRRALPVAQAQLDGAYRGPAQFRAWLAEAACWRHGFTTRAAPVLSAA
ncbi:hypothetical protein [Pseudoroseomonas cervicalis]|uniref:hypothetical protein n=1 Tax=Teichococcus cervicalis TaxID=204525 RepID=UPI0022F16F20|nr:hypothetical protein [Pseudoroseomonas cervicalis]WBV45462.1 hypothetical protein PFY06_21525 [Pseudoroseomonas cervicalis]